MTNRIYTLLKDGKIVTYTTSEAAAWDAAAMKLCLLNWWTIHWNRGDYEKAIIRKHGYEVKGATVIIDGDDLSP